MISQRPPLENKHLARRLLRQGVFDTLLQSILTGELGPNERLRDQELTTSLGVSRTPVREALANLAMLGLVKTVPNQHTTVAPLDEKEVIDAIDVLCLLYPECLRQIDLGPAAAGRDTGLIQASGEGRDFPSSTDLVNQVVELGTALGKTLRNPILFRTVSVVQLNLVRVLRSDPQLLGDNASRSELQHALENAIHNPDLAEETIIGSLRAIQQRLITKSEMRESSAATLHTTPLTRP